MKSEETNSKNIIKVQVGDLWKYYSSTYLVVDIDREDLCVKVFNLKTKACFLSTGFYLLFNITL